MWTKNSSVWFALALSAACGARNNEAETGTVNDMVSQDIELKNSIQRGEAALPQPSGGGTAEADQPFARTCPPTHKVMICHFPPGHSGGKHLELCVGEPAVDQHVQQHGDTIGVCPSDAPPVENPPKEPKEPEEHESGNDSPRPGSNSGG